MGHDEMKACFDASDLTATVVSAYLETPSKEPQAAHTTTTRWKSMRRELAEAGADGPTLEAMDAAVGVDSEAVEPGISPAPGNVSGAGEIDDRADHAGGEVLAVIAEGGRVRLRRFLPTATAAGRWRVGGLPWVTPLLEASQGALAHLVVLIDRQGADIWGITPAGEVLEQEVQGRTFPISRVGGGGWSHRRIQQRAVDTWEANAKEVAAEVAELAHRLGARLVAVAGDAHTVSSFTDAASAELGVLLRPLSSGARGPESGLVAALDEVDRLVRTVEAEDTRTVLATYREEVGQHDRAASGAGPVVAALQAAMVETLLVHDDGDDERPAWCGPSPFHVGIEREDLVSMGVDEPVSVRLVDACVRAALGSGAAVRVVPAEALEEGLGAVLRPGGRAA